MRLVSVKVTAWRGLDAEVGELHPGLNLVLGPNESGKSRLLEALRFGLFERSAGAASHKAALQAWGRADPPQVVIELEIEGARWRVEKQFGKRSHTLLAGGGATLKDDAADARLAALLGTEVAGSRQVGPEHLGLWSLLMVPQGASWQAPHEAMGASLRGRLHDRLAEATGEVVTGALGRHVLARAEKERGRYWNPKKGDATGELRRAIEERERAEQALAAASGRLAAARQQAKELSDVQAQLASLEPRLAEARKEHAEAQRRAQEARVGGQALKARRAEAETARAALDAARVAAERQADLAARLAAREGELAAAREAEAGQARAVEAAAAREAEAAEAARAAEAAAEAAEAAVARAEAAEQRRELRATLAERTDRLAKAREARAGAVEAAREVEASPATAEALKALRDVEVRLGRARARLEGVAAQVGFRALADTTVEGEDLPAGASRSVQVAEARTFRVGDRVEIEVRPGGAELPGLLDEARDLDRERTRRLAALGAGDLEAAEEAARARGEAARRAEAAQARVADLAPEGLDALEADVARLRGRVAAQAAEEEAEAPGREAAAQAKEAARVALAEARGHRQAASTALAEAKERRAAARERAAGLDKEVGGLRQQLAEAGAADALAGALAAAERAFQDAVAVRDKAQRDYETLGGDEAGADVARLDKALRRLEEDQGARVRREAELRGSLGHLGAEALYEQQSEAENALDAARAEEARVLRDARAARRLYAVLLEAQAETRARLVEPVIAQVRPWLAEIFPGSELALGEDWEVVGLRTGDVDEGFDALSGGAREQLAVLVRLGLAEVLSGDGALPLVLDDPFTHSDPARRRALARVLDRAARRGQVLLLTCHDDAWDELGPDATFQLEGGRRVAPAGT